MITDIWLSTLNNVLCQVTCLRVSCTMIGPDALMPAPHLPLSQQNCTAVHSISPWFPSFWSKKRIRKWSQRVSELLTIVKRRTKLRVSVKDKDLWDPYTCGTKQRMLQVFVVTFSTVQHLTKEEARSFCGFIGIPKWLRGGGVGHLAAVLVSHTGSFSFSFCCCCWCLCCCCATDRLWPWLLVSHSTTIRKWVVAPWCWCWGERPLLLSKESITTAGAGSDETKSNAARPKECRG